jgi:hypothetical protein
MDWSKCDDVEHKPGRISGVYVIKGTRIPVEGHDVKTAYERGWAALRNGDVIEAYERAGFTVMITADQSLAISAKCRGSVVVYRGVPEQPSDDFAREFAACSRRN